MASQMNGHRALTLEQAKKLDASDPLASFRERFLLPEGVYLDGNSLGALPRATPDRIAEVVRQEWGNDLITSWNKNKWMDLPSRIGGKLGKILGAKANEVVACDSTSVNIFKSVSAAMDLQPDKQRKLIVSELKNFPTDLYMLEGLIKQRNSGYELKLLEDPLEILQKPAWLKDAAVVLLTHVSYCTGRMLPMKAITDVIHESGGMAVWDLSHSAGAVPVDLNEAGADLALGCGYKYLNGGPGAPAFIFCAERHHEKAINPLSGWYGHAGPFAFKHYYEPAAGVNRFLVGTAPVIALSSLEVGVDLLLEADQTKLRTKSIAMGEFFRTAVEQECSQFGFKLWSPQDPEERGSHINFTHPNGYAIVQALIARGVVGDFRAPNVLRFGFTPLYVSFEDLWNSVQILKEVMEKKEWDCEEFKTVKTVT